MDLSGLAAAGLGGYSAMQIQQMLAAKKAKDDADVLRSIYAMQQAGVTPEQMHSLSGGGMGMDLGGNSLNADYALKSSALVSANRLGRADLARNVAQDQWGRQMDLAHEAANPFNIVSYLDAMGRSGNPYPLNNPVVQNIKPMMPDAPPQGPVAGKLQDYLTGDEGTKFAGGGQRRISGPVTAFDTSGKPVFTAGENGPEGVEGKGGGLKFTPKAGVSKKLGRGKQQHIVQETEQAVAGHAQGGMEPGYAGGGYYGFDTPQQAQQYAAATANASTQQRQALGRMAGGGNQPQAYTPAYQFGNQPGVAQQNFKDQHDLMHQFGGNPPPQPGSLLPGSGDFTPYTNNRYLGTDRVGYGVGYQGGGDYGNNPAERAFQMWATASNNGQLDDASRWAYLQHVGPERLAQGQTAYGVRYTPNSGEAPADFQARMKLVQDQEERALHGGTQPGSLTRLLNDAFYMKGQLAKGGDPEQAAQARSVYGETGQPTAGPSSRQTGTPKLGRTQAGGTMSTPSGETTAPVDGGGNSSQAAAAKLLGAIKNVAGIDPGIIAALEQGKVPGLMPKGQFRLLPTEAQQAMLALWVSTGQVASKESALAEMDRNTPG